MKENSKCMEKKEIDLDEMFDKKNTYNQHVSCTNCDFDGNISIIRGERVYDQICPVCGCNTLQKDSYRIKY